MRCPPGSKRTFSSAISPKTTQYSRRRQIEQRLTEESSGADAAASCRKPARSPADMLTRKHCLRLGYKFSPPFTRWPIPRWSKCAVYTTNWSRSFGSLPMRRPRRSGCTYPREPLPNGSRGFISGIVTGKSYVCSREPSDDNPGTHPTGSTAVLS